MHRPYQLKYENNVKMNVLTSRTEKMKQKRFNLLCVVRLLAKISTVFARYVQRCRIQYGTSAPKMVMHAIFHCNEYQFDSLLQALYLNFA